MCVRNHVCNLRVEVGNYDLLVRTQVSVLCSVVLENVSIILKSLDVYLKHWYFQKLSSVKFSRDRKLSKGTKIDALRRRQLMRWVVD